MAAIDVERLVAPVSADAPCGENLENDFAYMELPKLAEGTPAMQVGQSVIPAVEPDWKELRNRCLELLGRTRDLRVGVYLDMALLSLEGLPGLRDGLSVLRAWIENFWEPMYPRLDPLDGNDPTERINILRVYASRDPERGDSRVVRMVRESPLLNSRAGRFGLKDFSPNGTAKDAAGGGPAAPDPALIAAAAKETDPQLLHSLLQAAEEARASVAAIEAAVDKYVGARHGIDLKDLATTLAEISTHLRRFLAQHAGESSGPSGSPDTSPPDGASTANETGVVVSVGKGEIRSPADIKRLIDRMCEFYARTEPSSPVPLLLRRAQRLVGKNFLEILTDLSPSAIEGVKVISGEDPASAEAAKNPE